MDPVAFHIPIPFTGKSVSIYWYALAYIAGFLGGWAYAAWLVRGRPNPPHARHIEDFLVWAILGVILGGRIGYVLFYDLPAYTAHPADVLKLWKGGMSFHGGVAGVIAAILAFSYRRRISPYALADVVVCVAPIGLFLGRLANFVNGELFGRPTDLPWGMVFARAGDALPRHPSQLYEAMLEGLLLFFIMAVLWTYTRLKDRPGALTGCFLMFYALFRSLVELVRQPDEQITFLPQWITMGQILCIPLAALGLFLVWRSGVKARRGKPA
jgi:phosphatidylglycerol:prolipoprotein diacylglycerol transferase